MKLKIIQVNGYNVAVNENVKPKVGDSRVVCEKLTDNSYCLITIHTLNDINNNQYEIILADEELNLDLPIIPDLYEPKGFDEYEYTQEDLKKAIDFGADIESGNIKVDYKKYGSIENQFIQSLKKVPKYIVIESENIYRLNYDGEKIGFPVHGKQPKLITLSNGKESVIIKEIIWD